MLSPPQKLVLVDRRFDDFDELAATASFWDLDLRQIDRGVFRGSIFQSMLGTMQIAEARFERRLEQQGRTPPGVVTFAVPASANVRFRWRRHEAGPDDLLVFPANGELQSVSNTCFHVFTISLPGSALHAAAEAAGLSQWPDQLQREKVTAHRLVPQLRSVLRTSIDRWTKLTAMEMVTLPGRIARLLVDILGHNEAPQQRLATLRQDVAIRRVETLILGHEHEPLSVGELCKAAKVSERTLRNAFQRKYGLSPKQYLIARRLNGVRRDLRQAAATGAPIAEVAAHWGFWHMGQFAADYRRHFGELPSETVSRCVERDYARQVVGANC
jgi:AraC family ethanolamine operon transcriptional activator